MSKPIEETWHAMSGGESIDEYRDPDHREEVWTVSPDPTKDGWNCDGGHPGYGMSEARAKLAACAPEAIRMLLSLERANRAEMNSPQCPICGWTSHSHSHAPDCAWLGLMKRAGAIVATKEQTALWDEATLKTGTR